MKKVLLAAALLPAVLFAQKDATLADQKAVALRDSLITWRRYLHQNPELSNREYNTAAFIAAHLQNLGLDIKTGVAKTGVVAILKGGKPGPVIALRADMDALPVTERANLPFASKVTTTYNGQQVGVMHACGHDTHVSILLATARVLSQMKKDIAGTVVFLFQPAEEGAPDGEEGGARLMIKEGALSNPTPDVIFGLHINAATEAGTIKYKSGAMMAATDAFTIKVSGRQAHGGYPWQGVDPIVVSAQIIQGLQTIVSRQSELVKAPVVITVGAIRSGLRFNIIPEQCDMLGTIRTLDSSMRRIVLDKIRTTVTNIAAASGATAAFTFENKTLVTYNDKPLLQQMLPSLQAAAGKDKTVEMEWVTGGEDFSFYTAQVPSLFFYLGGMPIGNDPAKAPSHHTPDFFIDDSRLDVGVKAFCHLVLDYARAYTAKGK